MATILQKYLLIRRPVTRLAKQQAVIYCGKRNVWSRESGISFETMHMLQKKYDISLAGFVRLMKRNREIEKKRDQQFVKERHALLGPNLAAAHFIVARGGGIKFVDKEEWVRKNKEGLYFIPNTYIPEFLVEGIDASGTDLMYHGLDNFVDLEHLKYLKFSNCPYFDDWCMAALYRFRNSLEILDVSNCKNVTERGLASLHWLQHLKGLRMSNMENVQNQEIIALLLEQSIPDLKIVGVNIGQLEFQEDHRQLDNSETVTIDTEIPPHLGHEAGDRMNPSHKHIR